MNDRCTHDQDCEVPDCPGPHVMSDPDEKIIELVARASRPTLAELYKRAKAQGLTRPKSNYH
jgi:hypothetical protein